MSLHELSKPQHASRQADRLLSNASNDIATAFHLAPDAMFRGVANDNVIARGAYLLFKRTLDLVVAVPALLVLWPVLLLIGLIIRLDSRGPAVFRQTRLGQFGKPFAIYKFRTMHVMENGDTIKQACRGDGRVTRVGGWLRRSSVDELPQLLNVIMGNMSLVGPRPHAKAHDLYYAARIPSYNDRQAVKPGITGWAQVHGHRGETSTVDNMGARIDYDRWYVQNASISLDVEILLRTPLELLRARNAH